VIRPGPNGDLQAAREAVDRLYERARDLEPGARAAYVDAAAGETPPLRDEVLSLLEQTQAAEEFFERLSEALPACPPQHLNPEPPIGQAVGHYEIREQIGAGGMGAVYRAHDTRLDRDVALKFLPPHLTADPEARERLLAEARAAAALEHPNLCTVYEIDETEDGRPFIAMALCEGETLKERLEREPLPPAEAVHVATQIAKGLSAAHARGILHRDVKPGNVMLTAGGSVKLVDFGLARMADTTPTRPGQTPGTLAYMSPEQVRGDPLDPRSDLWGLGVVLYEMVAGVRPFRGGSDRALIQAILHQDPEPLPEGRPAIPDRLARIVDRLLRKDRKDRYRSAEELLGELARHGTTGFRRIKSNARLITACAAAIVLVLSYTLRSDLDPGGSLAGSATAGRRVIAVLPFTVHGQDVDVWREGMVDLLSMGLDGAGGLRAIDSRTLLARWGEEVGDGDGADLAHALGVARASRARYALVGSAVAAGPQVRFAADVYDVESGSSLGQAIVEGPPDSVLTLVDRLGMQVLAIVFQEDSEDLPSIDLAAVTTSSLPALKAYLDGEVHFRRTELAAAIEAWERAVRADTLFALAYYGLAEAYAWDEGGNLGSPGTGRQMLDRAHRLADRLPPLEAALIRTKSSRWNNEPGSVAAVEAVAHQYPDVAEAWYNLGEAYYHQAGAMRGPEEGEAAFRRAAELQPASALYRAHLVDLAFNWRPDSTRVAREVEAYARLAPRAARTLAARNAFGLAFGSPRTRAQARGALDTLNPESASQVYTLLRHPRLAPELEAVFPAIERRLDDGNRDVIRLFRFQDLGARDGKVRQALTILDEPGTPNIVRYCGPLHLSVRDLPVPEPVLEERLAVTRADSSALKSASWVACAAGHAAVRGRWQEHAKLLAHAKDVRRRVLASGDSVPARSWERAAREAEAHGLWRQGRKEEALRAFQDILGNDAHGWRALWYVGRLAFELDRLDQAERAFRALWEWDGPTAQLYLARIYERTGRSSEALDAYESVIYAWRNADPELRPLVDEARRAITRLSGAGDESADPSTPGR
jgi:serine/threonine protein kinase/tetratricopeptide (TPR) repeat protein